MTKLTDSQLILLSRASQHAERIAENTGSMNAGAASKVAGALIRRKLMREVRTKPGMPIWRQDDNGRNLSLVITKAGRKVIGVDDDPNQSDKIAGSDNQYSDAPRQREQPKSQGVHHSPVRPGSKLATVVDLMRAKDGASISRLMAATGWLPHSTRAALTGLRKRGLPIVKTQCKGEPTVYRVLDARDAAPDRSGIGG